MRKKTLRCDHILEDRIEMIPFSTCWYWVGPLDKDGYGAWGKYRRRAHRVVYEKYVGAIPQGLFLCHACDTPGCVNPAHLFPATPKENMHDKIRKGRARDGTGKPYYLKTQMEILSNG